MWYNTRKVKEFLCLRKFLDKSFHYRAYLWYPLKRVAYASPWEYVLVDGVEWSSVDMIINELPIGKYNIEIKVSEDFVVYKNENGEKVAVSYPRTLTIPVEVTKKAE